MIWTIRTTVGRENAVIETLTAKIKNTGAAVAAILHPAELKGYIFIEGDAAAIETIIAGVPHVRGLIRKEVKLSELEKFLEVKVAEIKINRGDIIEIVGGPFKNERGKVTRVDTAKGEVTIELIEAAIPIPITVAIEMVKLIESAEKAETKPTG
ncbi:MAG: transcription elongation factor Spt5 [Candidatus Aenigmatarchaeota archaeon]|nr:transcription elongation factor Spt5 [Candidatus Aenigmarchaeota archaeon]